MKNVYYILDSNHIPIPVFDAFEWGRWFEVADRTVARDVIGEVVLISTVFLGLDHNFTSKDDPILFETMAFLDDGESISAARYRTWAEATAGHAYIKAEAERAMNAAEGLTIKTLKQITHVKEAPK